MSRVLSALFVTLLVGFLVGCIGTSPEQQEENALEGMGGRGDDDDDDGDEFHRPGQPCLTCHRDGYSPGDAKFVLAGTVYARATDRDGVEDVEVIITDGLDREIVATSNRAGNFFVRRGRGDERRGGEVRAGFDPVPPYRVRVRQPDGVEQVMESLIWREGSCATCHTLDGPHESSNGRVYAMEAP